MLYNKIALFTSSDAASATTLQNVSSISSSERKGSPLNLGSRAEAERSVLLSRSEVYLFLRSSLITCFISRIIDDSAMLPVVFWQLSLQWGNQTHCGAALLWYKCSSIFHWLEGLNYILCVGDICLSESKAAQVAGCCSKKRSTNSYPPHSGATAEKQNYASNPRQDRAGNLRARWQAKLKVWP